MPDHHERWTFERILIWPCEHGAFRTPLEDAYGRCRACGTSPSEWLPASLVASLEGRVRELDGLVELQRADLERLRRSGGHGLCGDIAEIATQRSRADAAEVKLVSLQEENERQSKRLRNVWALAARMWSASHTEEWGDVLTMIDGDWGTDEEAAYVADLKAEVARLHARVMGLEELREEDAQRHETAWKTMRGERDDVRAKLARAEGRGDIEYWLAEGARQERERLTGEHAVNVACREFARRWRGNNAGECMRNALAAVLSEEAR